MSRRRWAERAADAGLRLMPRGRRDWAEAVRAELAHIDDDGAALRFALGGVLNAGLQRLASGGVLRLGRLGVAGAAGLLGLALLAWAGFRDLGGVGLGPVLNLGLAALGLCYLGAAWALARGGVRGFAWGLGGALALVTVGALLLAAAPLVGGPMSSRWLSAMVIEEYILLTLLTTAGLVISRMEARARC